MPRNEELVYIGSEGEVFEYKPTPGKVLYRVDFGESPNVGAGRSILGLVDFNVAVSIADRESVLVPGRLVRESGVWITPWEDEDLGPCYHEGFEQVVIPTESSPRNLSSKRGCSMEVPESSYGYVTAHEIGHLRSVREGTNPSKGKFMSLGRDYLGDEEEADRRALEGLGRSELGREELEKSKDFRLGRSTELSQYIALRSKEGW